MVSSQRQRKTDAQAQQSLLVGVPAGGASGRARQAHGTNVGMVNGEGVRACVDAWVVRRQGSPPTRTVGGGAWLRRLISLCKCLLLSPVHSQPTLLQHQPSFPFSSLCLCRRTAAVFNTFYVCVIPTAVHCHIAIARPRNALILASRPPPAKRRSQQPCAEASSRSSSPPSSS